MHNDISNRKFRFGGRVRCLVLAGVFSSVVALAGCTQAERSQFAAYGEPHKITLYSGGVEIGQWETEGKILTESSSDGYLFTDKKSGKLKRVSGDVIIEVL